MSIQNDDKELFKKLREIQNRIIKIIDINNANDFVQTTLDDGVNLLWQMYTKIQALLKVVIVMNL